MTRLALGLAIPSHFNPFPIEFACNQLIQSNGSCLTPARWLTAVVINLGTSRWIDRDPMIAGLDQPWTLKSF
jgi:hypothetical protein